MTDANKAALAALEKIINFPEYPDLTPLTESEMETLDFIKVHLETIRAALTSPAANTGDALPLLIEFMERYKRVPAVNWDDGSVEMWDRAHALVKEHQGRV